MPMVVGRSAVRPLLAAAGGGALLLGATILVLAELAHARANGRRLGEEPQERAVRKEAVVVLGYGNRGERANLMNRYRVRAGIRSLDPEATERVLVLCGGAVRGDVAEAELMAGYARDELGYRGALILEGESRSTLENIERAIPLIEDADSIKIVSNSHHAEKGRAHLRMLRPDLARRLRRGAEHRFGEMLLVKPVAAVLGWRSLRGL